MKSELGEDTYNRQRHSVEFGVHQAMAAHRGVERGQSFVAAGGVLDSWSFSYVDILTFNPNLPMTLAFHAGFDPTGAGPALDSYVFTPGGNGFQDLTTNLSLTQGETYTALISADNMRWAIAETGSAYADGAMVLQGAARTEDFAFRAVFSEVSAASANQAHGRQVACQRGLASTTGKPKSFKQKRAEEDLAEQVDLVGTLNLDYDILSDDEDAPPKVPTEG